ncbi:MAG: translation initiation factor [Flavobacteriaceae bacterium]|nr:translation initiation factor [Mangrovimonas sp.]MCB0434018.1 translation initiation factor [Mangrovimonas sp.]MCB0439434.1 translation initiation factor [Mangrovimonas sp.]HPF97635.1 translation initiation factor [Mangrovimonas sp.]HRV56216.1 translation initiation factor [Mangrovimonas sp.]
MDLQDQLRKLFPEHNTNNEPVNEEDNSETIWLQEDPIICKFEKRNGRPVTILEGYNGAKDDFKILSKHLKTHLSVGGSIKGETIIIQGDYRDKIMSILKDMGFKVKRVGG